MPDSVDAGGHALEHHDVVAGQEHRGQCDAAALSATELADLTIERDFGQQVLDDGAGVGLGERLGAVVPQVDDAAARPPISTAGLQWPDGH